ncbi:hypothetical protein Sarmat_00469 [Rickettsiales endosymbiont of Paramecium tredecaurelia]|uniref:hypothetical protein n=1 Tax=Candidatus Sarmatiella mevalonica TaxID=2770581 RepID=UPI001920AB47|nr:hypothetical protein [Candidatus Sarmatiella mevalonica]MBL3284619.1 hypothetical protein [Candidatus Sarmatiella mevalonica]
MKGKMTKSYSNDLREKVVEYLEPVTQKVEVLEGHRYDWHQREDMRCQRAIRVI